jgi:hypothetical protein
MNAETQKEFDIKKKFVLDNQKEFLAGGVVPGYKEAMLWLKATKESHLDKKAVEAKEQEIRKYIAQNMASAE